MISREYAEELVSLTDLDEEDKEFYIKAVMKKGNENLSTHDWELAPSRMSELVCKRCKTHIAFFNQDFTANMKELCYMTYRPNSKRPIWVPTRGVKEGHLTLLYGGLGLCKEIAMTRALE